MGLEHWDSSKRKYVLYQNTEQQNADCNRFPFESIPRRIFLDTNVISVLVKHSTHVFEQDPIAPNTEPTLAIDIEALMHVFYVGRWADWSLVGSQKTLDELSRTRDSILRDDLLEYALGLVNQDLDDEDRKFAGISDVGWLMQRSSPRCQTWLTANSSETPSGMVAMHSVPATGPRS
jgi:hypothetical protein